MNTACCEPHVSRLGVKTFILLVLLCLTSCRPTPPSDATPAGRTPNIQPDYVDVTIPCNLCPINFGVREQCREVVARLSTPTLSFTYGHGMQVIIDPSEWQQLTTSAVGGDIRVELWSRDAEGWTAYDPFTVHVSPDSIDSWITYRLIPPSYVAYEELIIEQRNLTTFETRELYNNQRVQDATHGQCINCHSFQNYRTRRFLFHIRQAWGGTVIVNDGKVSKVDLKRPETISAGVYPAWHPTEQLIAFSTNRTAQVFHSVDPAKVEVFDSASGLILYDPLTDQVTTIVDDSLQLETFPTWSPDGGYLYYCSARLPYVHNDSTAAASPDISDPALLTVSHYQELRYDLLRRSFDPVTRQFGEAEMVYQASADSLSVTLPRISPDGRWLTCSVAPYGCFHVWHPSADIALIDLAANEAASTDTTALSVHCSRLMTFSSPTASDSYPSFSSTGRWLMCASRRDDGNYTRPYIAHFAADGNIDKPFEVPQQSPAFYNLSFKSFNRPEFTIEPVTTSISDFSELR